MKTITGKKTVPRVFINGKYIGGYSDLSSSDLDRLVNEKKLVAQN
jgi:glutaredoxin